MIIYLIYLNFAISVNFCQFYRSIVDFVNIVNLIDFVDFVDFANFWCFRYNTVVNATDKWGFTPLHEAAQKGRTQLCALLLAHGADPTLKNQEGQTPLDLCSADDVKCLLQDAMPTTLVLPTTTKTSAPSTNPGPRPSSSMNFGPPAGTDNVVMPSGE